MKVLHVIKTDSFKSDIRLLRWIDSLKYFHIKSEILILEDQNESKYFEMDNIHVSTISLFFRKYFKKGKGLLFKIPEFSIKSLSYIKKSNADLVVFHDSQHYLTLLYLCIFKNTIHRPIVWDLHELPHTRLSKYYATRRVVKYILENVDLLIYTNIERRKCILNLFLFNENEYSILNNYPQKSFIVSPKTGIPTEIKEWIKEDPYILWMGKASRARNFHSILELLKSSKISINVVVMGSVEKEIQDYIENYQLNDMVFSRYVNQEDIIKYVDNALFSFVFYNSKSLNSFYCEPNRLYQLITRNIPVVVGNNPPMKSTVEKFNSGIILPDDGSNIETLSIAFYKMMDEKVRNSYKRNMEATNFANALNWDDQFLPIYKKLISL